MLRQSSRGAIVVVCLAFTLPTLGQSQSDVLDRFSITLGSFLSSSKTTVRVDGDIPGTEIDFEEVLGLDDSAALGRGEFEWLFKEKHMLGLGYYSLDRSRTDAIKADIIIDGDVYPIDTIVKSGMGITFYDISYTYWVLRKENQALGIKGGLVGMSISTRLETVPQSGSSQGLDLETRSSVDLPVPGLGVSYKLAFGNGFLFDAKAGFLPRVTIDDYKGDTLNASAALEYRFLDHYAVGAAYNHFGFRFEVEKPSFTGSISYVIQGGQAYLRFYW